MEIWAASASAKLLQSNRTDKWSKLAAQFTLVEQYVRLKNNWLGENC